MANTITINPATQIRSLATDVANQFVARLNGLKLTVAEQAIVSRASERVVAAAMLTPGATDEVSKHLALQRDLGLAALANLGVAKSIDAVALLKQTAQDVLFGLLKVGLGLVVAAV